MKIAVIDAQGGGIGKVIVEQLRKALGTGVEIIVLGTNALATSAMMKAGANEGATGENAICYSSRHVDVIVGTIGIIAANSMLGEVTPAMAQAISESPAKKILVPFNRCHIEVVGTTGETLPQLIESLVKAVQRFRTEDN